MIFNIRLLVAGLLFAAAVHADETKVPVWHIAGEHNDVYLLASVHLLRASDYPLPAGIDAAYADAETLVMELDMDDLDQAEAAQIVAELGVIRDGSDLATMLGADNYAKAEKLAVDLSIPLAAFASNEPWLAAITMEQMLLVSIGFNPALGIESQLMERAITDGKEIRGLETLRQQLEILDRLPLAVQRELLLQTLEEAREIETSMNDLLAAWRRGDTAALEKSVLTDMREQPLLYNGLVAQRNRNWLQQIEDLLTHQDDYLVVVGTLHLVGEDGLPALLQKRGIEVTQLTVGGAAQP